MTLCGPEGVQCATERHQDPMAQHAAPAHAVQGTTAASQLSISEPTWKGLTDAQGSWLYLGKEFPQACPTSNLPTRHHINQAQGRLTPAHPTGTFLASLLQESLNFTTQTPLLRPMTQHTAPRPRTAGPWGPEAAAPWMGRVPVLCLELQVCCPWHAAAAGKLQAIPASLTTTGRVSQELLLKGREMNHHPNAGSASQRFHISPRQCADVLHSGGFYGCGFVSSSKAGGTAFTPKLWAAPAKRRVGSMANMQLLVPWLGRHVWPCSRGG